MENPTIYPAPLKVKHVPAPISMALEEIEKILKKMLKEHGIMIRNFNEFIGLDRLCQPSTLSRKSLSDVKFAIDRYEIKDRVMTDSSMKNLHIEASGAFYVYEKIYFLYKDCFLHGFQSLINREKVFREQEKMGKSTPKKVLDMEDFQKILKICEANKEEYPKLLKLKEIVTSYHYGFVKKNNLCQQRYSGPFTRNAE